MALTLFLELPYIVFQDIAKPGLQFYSGYTQVWKPLARTLVDVVNYVVPIAGYITTTTYAPQQKARLPLILYTVGL
jgi:hypothetical protein